MLRFDILTIFPEFFGAVFDYGIVRRARAAAFVEIHAHDLRAWTTDKHRITDDRPFGGGDGMVMKLEPIFAAVEDLTRVGSSDVEGSNSQKRVVLLSPQGRSLTQSFAADLAMNAKQIVLICGRYEGVDERVAAHLVTDEISIGDYVLSGGEPAAVVLIDAVTRLVPGALGSETSAVNESFSDGLLDFPHYTRPPVFREMTVPDVLLEGHHAAIAHWRRRAALLKTKRNRPDLIERAALTEEEKAWLDEN
ncbi:MAG: tRNA (guanosine(37)-N1)-methyltransferase TrmD [Pyrinomonadaceae bacterium MAG19_C2-C3]|nr:tRNA (guanosine(37)-N1)-methyltransferase TrmD [Pyrinomonadaceae bacterium MAG19_C2-C3]